MLKLDKEVLAATATALGKVSDDVPALLRRADGLDVGYAVSGLRAAPAWAGDTQTDLLARIGLIQRMEDGNLSFDGMTLDQSMAAHIAGASATVSTSMTDLKVASLLKYRKDGSIDDSWAWQPGQENFSDYLARIESKAGADAMGRPDLQPKINAALNAVNEVRGLVTAGAASTAAFTQLITKGGSRFLTWAATKGLLDPVTGKLASADANVTTRLANAFNSGVEYFNKRQGIQNAWTRPGAFKFKLAEKLGLRGLDTARNFDEWYTTAASKLTKYGVGGEPAGPTTFAKILQSRFGQQAKGWIETALKSNAGSLLITKGGAAIDFVFGKPWTGVVNGQTVNYVRQGGNLLNVAGAEGFGTAVKTAGAFRVLGVAGGAFATVDSAWGIAANWDEETKAWTEGGTKGKAKVIGDFAEVGFNASLTAAMIAPNPITLGAVAVTGLVYGGARLVEHWDDVTKKMGEVKDWAADRVDDAAKWAGDRLDDLKKSDLNPMNWF